jgi:hypothetical protein
MRLAVIRFVSDPALTARDGLHPSDAGYRLWWQLLSAQWQAPHLMPGSPASPSAGPALHTAQTRRAASLTMVHLQEDS